MGSSACRRRYRHRQSVRKNATRWLRKFASVSASAWRVDQRTARNGRPAAAGRAPPANSRRPSPGRTPRRRRPSARKAAAMSAAPSAGMSQPTSHARRADAGERAGHAGAEVAAPLRDARRRAGARARGPASLRRRWRSGGRAPVPAQRGAALPAWKRSAARSPISAPGGVSPCPGAARGRRR